MKHSIVFLIFCSSPLLAMNHTTSKSTSQPAVSTMYIIATLYRGDNNNKSLCYYQETYAPNEYGDLKYQATTSRSCDNIHEVLFESKTSWDDNNHTIACQIITGDRPIPIPVTTTFSDQNTKRIIAIRDYKEAEPRYNLIINITDVAPKRP